MNNKKTVETKKLFRQEMNRISKYISTEDKKTENRQGIVHQMYIIQQIGAEDFDKIGPIIEQNFRFDKIIKELESKKQMEHLIQCDMKTSKCMDCIKKVIGKNSAHYFKKSSCYFLFRV